MENMDKKVTICAHTLVKNEARYLWYSVASVINYVDKVLLWDDNSFDITPQIAAELRKMYPDKIDYKRVDSGQDPFAFTKIRQEMLTQTDSDWLLILDGDEVWWEDSIKAVRKLIEERGSELETIVNPYYNLVGDIFHYQDESAGSYKIDGKVGHITVRAINTKIPGLHIDKPHGRQGFYDGDGRPIQERDASKRKFLDVRYLHFTHLVRSESREKDEDVQKRGMKLKYELGNAFPLDFYYPEVFFRERPAMVPTPWERVNKRFLLRAFFETPLRRVRRKIIKPKSGY